MTESAFSRQRTAGGLYDARFTVIMTVVNIVAAYAFVVVIWIRDQPIVWELDPEGFTPPTPNPRAIYTLPLAAAVVFSATFIGLAVRGRRAGYLRAIPALGAVVLVIAFAYSVLQSPYVVYCTRPVPVAQASAQPTTGWAATPTATKSPPGHTPVYTTTDCG